LLSTLRTFDAPLWPVASLLSAGARYRALRRLPGQVLHLLEERVFQDAPCRDYIRALGSTAERRRFSLESSPRGRTTTRPASGVSRASESQLPLSRNARKRWLRLGWRSLRRALASICRMRSRVTAKF